MSLPEASGSRCNNPLLYVVSCNAHYLTTENPDRFRQQAQIFLHEPVDVEKITLG